MIASKSKHPNCMYKWMNWITSPKVQAQVAEWFGEAPANRAACAHTAAKDHCKIFHEGDQPYFARVSFWTTPIKDCGDSRGDACADYSKWVQAWTDIKG
jgi:putative spermidine/putrescine transport system substrate-binding protein